MHNNYKDAIKALLMRSVGKLRRPSGIITTAVFLGLGIFLVTQWRLFGRTANDGSTSLRTTFYFICLGLAGSYLHYMLRSGGHKPAKQIGVVRALLYPVAFSFLWVYTLEFICNFEQMEELQQQDILVSACISFVLFWALFLLFHSLKAVVVFGNVLYFIWAVASYYTLAFRGLPLQLNDLADIATAANVMGQYTYQLTGQMLCSFFVLALIAYNICLRPDRRIGRKTWEHIVSGVCGLALFVWMFWFILWSNGFARFAVSVDGNIPRVTFQKRGTQLSFFSSARDSLIREPEGYGAGEWETIAEAYESDAALSAEERPNVIVIMNETFADLDITGEKGLAQTVLPNYTALRENTVKGKLMVSTLGGGTGKTEYEFLTGNSMRLFNSSISPYVTFGTRLQDALASQFSAQGYSTVAIHPFAASNYNRERTYAAMGFDRFLSIADFPDAEKLRSFVTDAACYEAIYDLVEQEENPLFTFCVTIQNHSPYLTKDFASTVKLEGLDCPEAEQYLTLLQESDRQIGNLIQHFQNTDEKTVLIFFGDHFPSMPQDFWTYMTGKNPDTWDYEMSQALYQTPFFIWANYDIEEQAGVTLSANYLAAYALDAIDAPLTGYDKYLLELQKQVPAFNAFCYYGTDGKLHRFSEDTAVEQQLDIYDQLQYSYIFGGKERPAAFFVLK